MIRQVNSRLKNSTDIRTESILFAGLLSKSEVEERKRKHLELFLGYSENPPHNNWASSDKDLSYLEFFEGFRIALPIQLDKSIERDSFDKRIKKLLNKNKDINKQNENINKFNIINIKHFFDLIFE